MTVYKHDECPRCGAVLSYWAWPENTYAAWCCEAVWIYTGPLSAPCEDPDAKYAPVDGLLS